MRKAQNYFGPKLKSCYSGEFNVTEKEGKLYLNIFYQGKKVLTMRQYANPYHVAQGILGDKDPEKIIRQINQYQNWGLVAGIDFTITNKGLKRLHKDKRRK